MSSVVTLKVEGYRSKYNWCCVISGLTDSGRQDVLESLAPWLVDDKPFYVLEKMGRCGDAYLVIKINQRGAGPMNGEELLSMPDDIVNKLLNILAGMGLKVVGTQQQGQSSYGPGLFIWTLQ